MEGWVGGWMGVKAILRIAYGNQKERKKETNRGVGGGETKNTHNVVFEVKM